VLFSSEFFAKPDSMTGSVQRLDLDGRGVDVLVLDHLGLDGGRDGRVVDIGADRFLTARHRAAGRRQKHDRGDRRSESGAKVHGGFSRVD
jgi:hypothetical protein